AQQLPHHDYSSSLHPTATTETLPTETPIEIPILRKYFRRATWIAQSKALPTAADEPASLLRDDTVSVPPVAEVSTVGVPTGSGLVPTVSAIFTTSSVATPYSRRPREISAKDKGKEKLVESDMPKKKKLQEQINVQMAREMKEKMAREDQRMDEQIARDAKIAKIHAEEELQMLINSLDRNNEVIAKHLQDYEQSGAELSIGEKIELINELEKYQDHHLKILKGMTLEEIREKFIPVWKQIKDFVHMASKEEGKRVKRKGLIDDVASAVEEVYVEALQVKHPIIDWEIHTKGKKDYWKIIKLGGHTSVYQFFVDMLKQLDREDLNQLWTLVKETLSIRQASSDKEKELWVELKRLFEPDFEDQLWTYTQALMYDPVE
nr:hypothetical protein [Tanacetum cinerariifolium]